MRISFDLDGTLISEEFQEFETQNVIQKLFKFEKLRYGTVELFKRLKQCNHEILIYTTSYRSVLKIKLTFFSYGLNPAKIINQELNERTLKKLNIKSSKYPPAFNIQIHVDDSKGVEMESKKFGFNMILVDKNDANWTQKIKDELGI